MGHCSIAVRTSGPQSREPGFKSSCCRFEALAILFIPCSVSGIEKYLATDRWISEQIDFVQ